MYKSSLKRSNFLLPLEKKNRPFITYKESYFILYFIPSAFISTKQLWLKSFMLQNCYLRDEKKTTLNACLYFYFTFHFTPLPKPIISCNIRLNNYVAIRILSLAFTLLRQNPWMQYFSLVSKDCRKINWFEFRIDFNKESKQIQNSRRVARANCVYGSIRPTISAIT